MDFQFILKHHKLMLVIGLNIYFFYQFVKF